MPLSSRTSQTKKTSKKVKRQTPSFVCEVPLCVTRRQERTLDKRFEAGRQLYNALLGEAKNRLVLVRQSIWYTKAKKSTDKKERQAHFSAARQAHGFSLYALEAVADKMRRTTWLGDHLDSHVAQKLAKRAFEAVYKVALGKAKAVRFKGERGLHSLEGKSNAACIRWRDDRIMWNGLELPMAKGAQRDPVIRHGLASRVKYVRLVRRDVRGKTRYYAQLVCEGVPYVKVNEKGERIHPIGQETVGLDIGPSTIAIVGDTQALLTPFADAVVRDHQKIRRLQRKQDRQRRANNPDCYDDKGRAIKGKRPTQKSRHQLETEAVLRERHRREAAHRKTLHGQLANQVIAIGPHIKTEKLSYKAFQKMYGRSISVRAPKLFLSILTRKAESAGGAVEEFSTYHTALSQACLCGQKHKKRLSERIHACDCGIVMQRDLFSAYLAKHVENECLQVANANEHWPGAEPLLRTAWQQATNQPASGQPGHNRTWPSSFGTYRSQSGSSEKDSLPEHEAQDVVAMVQATVRACESAKV
ncbi:Transposase [Sulfobacillus thermosulfidooxidans DSM 9293]|uniref:Transposase n=1 Tax=Sulfobacillus thermosulfidooxidans (strain DSM 9293 / VKM B-1269 / AT-1) TaxID=929705 RepID=A0A1W1W794_SULTA|nr:RNA-guided endonuclease TnpB family protein [Sulfobacillus thermosulfidooxidans]SMC01999.1 Transposase [Sulfobacillus thermosulfidooxidans DSM 9293]